MSEAAKARCGALVRSLASVPALFAFISASMAADAASGNAVFSRCAACHTKEQGSPNGIGPNLFGVIGRKAATKPDFPYSTALRKSHIVWTPQKLDAWIANPAMLVPGTRMIFAGISDAHQRADLLAYLETLK